MAKLPKFIVGEGAVERVSFSGESYFDSTVMIQVGRRGLSKRALVLGLMLVLCHVVDGLLTFMGMELFGAEAEGNGLLKKFMLLYGHTTVLFVAKTFAIGLTITLMFFSHKRLWIRPVIAMLILIYLLMAVFPWFYILSEYLATSR